MDRTEKTSLSNPDVPKTLTLPVGSPWPAAIFVGLLIVVVVNMVFIYIAFSGADPVVPSYLQQR